MVQLLAFHAKASLKAETVKAMKADIKAERLQPGHYWNGKNGCFVGCVIRGDQHSKFEDVLGIPRILARLGDRLYEGLADRNLQQKFAVDFLEAIKPGADLTSVWNKFAEFMLIDKDYGVIQYAKTERTKKTIQEVGNLYRRINEGEKIDDNEWLNVRKNAYAAYAAAYADAYAAYASASAASAAAAAASAAAFAALATALIRFLSEAKVVDKEAA